MELGISMPRAPCRTPQREKGSKNPMIFLFLGAATGVLLALFLMVGRYKDEATPGYEGYLARIRTRAALRGARTEHVSAFPVRNP